MRNQFLCLLLLCQVLLPFALLAQEPPSDSSTAVCTFDDERQMSVQYGIAKSTEKVANGRAWAPGGKPMFLFTQSDLVLKNATIPVGAYSMWVIPGKANWTLIVSKNVDPAAKYDDKQDVVRAPMDIGQLSEEEKQFTVVFGHNSAKQCAMRFYFGKMGAFTEFDQK